MSTTPVPVGDRTWSTWEISRPAVGSPRVERLLPRAFAALLAMGDVLIVVAAFLVTFWARGLAPDGTFPSSATQQPVVLATVVAVITLAVFAAQGMYDLDHPRPWSTRVYSVVSGISMALVASLALSFLMGDQLFSRLWYASGWLLSVTGLILWRSVFPSRYAVVRDWVGMPERAIVVGSNPLHRDFIDRIAQHRRIVGYVENGDDRSGDGDLPFLGPVARLEWLVQESGAAEVIIALPPERREQIGRIIDRGFHRPVKITFLPELPDVLPQRFEVGRIGGRPCITFSPAARVGIVKRVLDLCLGVVVIIGLLPLLALIAFAVKIDSRGPILYRQQRVGKDGTPFSMYKFRSMCQDADRRLEELRARNEASGPLFKMREDPRITRVGKVLRRLSLDELPQLFNVLRGEMSLVGPRPPLPSEVEQYEDWQFGRLRAVPGMTGLWQVSGRSEVPFLDMVRLDLEYIRNWSIRLDLAIMLRTIPAILTQHGSY